MLPVLFATARSVTTSPAATACLAWLAKMIAKILARHLQMPEALVHDAGRYVHAQIDTFERQLLLSWLSCGASSNHFHK